MAIDHLLSGEIFFGSFGLVKVPSLQDLLSSEMLTLLGNIVSVECGDLLHRRRATATLLRIDFHSGSSDRLD